MRSRNSDATPEDKATAILLSWKRVQNMPDIVAEVASWRRVDEVLVWNNNPETTLSFKGATVINAGRNFGCFARYGLVGLAANQIIWFQDDDIALDEDQFERVFAAFEKDPTRIYGCQGRNVVDGAYSPKPVYGPCDIVVGQAMLFHRALTRHIHALLARHDIPTDEDDILFSLACPGPHFAVNVEPVKEIGWDDEHALWRRPGHFEARQRQIDVMRAALRADAGGREAD